MSLNRKFNRNHPKMKQLNFPAQSYSLVKEVYTYNKTEESIVGVLELLWSSIDSSPLQDLTKKDHKTNKSLKRKLREVTQYKDKDQDSRVTLLGPQVILLEEEELSLLKRHIESNKYISKASEDVDFMWNIIDTAKDYTPPKPTLMKDG